VSTRANEPTLANDPVLTVSTNDAMSSTAGPHGPDHSEGLVLYVLQTLPPSEARAVEAQVAACAECRQEKEALRPVLDAFVAWPTDVLRPTASLWDRLARRIAAETGSEPFVPEPRPSTAPEWKEVAPGISCKLLATDPETHRVSLLVRLAPGTPPTAITGSKSCTCFTVS
jgi:hypothetical protein